MNTDLTQLRDIHIPPAIGWWPIAPGWYILIALSILLVASISFLIYRYYRNTRVRRHALSLLTHYQKKYAQEGHTQQSSAQVSELLKRVALFYFPRKEVANLQGEAWITFLTRTANNIDFNTVRIALLELPYQPEAPTAYDLNPLFAAAKTWIKQRRKPCLT